MKVSKSILYYNIIYYIIDLRFLELSLHRHVKNFDRAHPGWAAVNIFNNININFIGVTIIIYYNIIYYNIL